MDGQRHEPECTPQSAMESDLQTGSYEVVEVEELGVDYLIKKDRLIRGTHKVPH